MRRLSDAQRKAISILRGGPLFYHAGRWFRRGTPGAHPSVVDNLVDRGLARKFTQRRTDGLTITLCRLTTTGEQAGKDGNHG